MPIIQIKDFIIATPQTTLFTIDSAIVQPMSKIALVAPNGSGKTTLIKQILADNKQVKIIGDIGYLAQLESVKALSAGQYIKKRLTELLYGSAACLILDEPTANLDASTRKWLIMQLQRTNKALLLISHDRELLNAIATEIWYINDMQLQTYSGCYSDYLKMRASQAAKEIAAFEQQQTDRQRLENVIHERKQRAQSIGHHKRNVSSSEAKANGLMSDYEAKGRKMAKSAKSITKRLEKAPLLKQPRKEKHINIQLKRTTTLNLRPIKLLDSTNQIIYREKQSIFEIKHFAVKFGEHIGLVGDNGSGKSTFLKQLFTTVVSGKPLTIYQYPKIKIGFFNQLLDDFPKGSSILHAIEQTSSQDKQVIYDLLGALGFRNTTMQKPYSVLSGGEKVRANLANVLLGDYNILFLDEPNNYLDLDALQALTTFLQAYRGAVILVSHDNEFINSICHRQYKIGNNKMHEINLNEDVSNPKKRFKKQQLTNQIQELEFKKDKLMLTTNSSIAEIRYLNQQISQLKKELS